jgi:hypothetical protein
MPTIEIASINTTQLGLTKCDFKVAIIEEHKLQSDRGLFSIELSKHNGTIIHIGNPEYKQTTDNGFFAGNLIDWGSDKNEYLTIPNEDPTDTGANEQYVFKFLEDFKPDIDRLLKIALDASPIKRVFFLTDYQFGPEEAHTEIIYTISDFWTQHDNDGIQFNTLYEMYGL